MKSSPWTDIVKMQRELYLCNQHFIDSTVTVREHNFEKYRKTYQYSTSTYKAISTHDEMMADVMAADIIIVGDYHTCPQSQRSFLRILKAMAKKDADFAVGLELLSQKHQEDLDKFCRKKIGEKSFLKRIKLEEHWVFDLWPNFKPIFDFCRYHHLPMLALDLAQNCSSVRIRDEATAELAADYFAVENKKLFILIGDLHLAPQHLPKLISEALKRRGVPAKILILYENCDGIYWDLAKKGLAAEVEVVKISDTSYCRLHTPPVVCQQSYINWLEHEEGEIDYSDARHSFLSLVSAVCKFLKIKLSVSHDDLEVYTCGDLSFFQLLQNDKRFLKDEIDMIRQQILSNESYFIAKAGIVYLGCLSLNHAAEEASHYIKYLCTGPERPREVMDAFYANVLHEMLGFFGSKIANHQRKCSHWPELEETVKFFKRAQVPPSRRLEIEAARLAIELHSHEGKTAPDLDDLMFLRPDLAFAASHILGYMLGDKLYYGLLHGVVTRREVKQMYYDRWLGEGTPFAIYRRLSKRLNKIRIPKRM